MLLKFPLRLCIAAALLFIYVQQARAAEPRLSFGIKAGLTASHFNNSIGPYAYKKYGFIPDHRISVEGGIVCRYSLNRCFSLQGEALMNLRGMSYRKEIPGVMSYTSGGATKTYSYNTFCVNYAELPLLVNLNLTRLLLKPDARGGLMLSAGIVPSYCFKSSVKYNGLRKGWGSEPDAEYDHSENDFNYANPLLLNFAFDITANAPVFGSSSFFLFARFMQSAGNVYRIDQLTGQNLRTSMNSVSAGIGFIL
jgi:hypothetical protein